jgi:hypothetical protein
MRNDFMPVHLMNANAKLDKHVLADEARNRTAKSTKNNTVEVSLWEKFVGLFKK